MCLYPTLIKNPKYLPNKKNGGYPPKLTDRRAEWVPIGCGNCIECRKQKANSWRVRLERELQQDQFKGVFVTLTFSDESLKKIEDYINRNEENAFENLTKYEKTNKIAKTAVKLFRERWRKKYRKSIKHWLVTELGHEGTQRLHLHGILFCNQTKKEIEQTWQYGWIYCGTYCNKKTINYIVKYVTKLDKIHTDYKQIILTSPGIGNCDYEKSYEGFKARFQGRKTDERYRMGDGSYRGIPMYLRGKIYSEQQRELLWMYRLDKQTRWVRGVEIDVSTEQGEKNYQNALETAQRDNIRMGFGKRSFDYKDYIKKCNMLKFKNIQFDKVVENFQKNNLFNRKQYRIFAT